MDTPIVGAVVNPRLEAALAYNKRGLRIVLCDGKRPVHQGWQDKTFTDDEIGTAFAGNPALNVGLVLGNPSGLIDMEEDGEQAAADFLELFAGCEIPRTPTWKARRGRHRAFKADQRLSVIGKTTVKYKGVEIRLGDLGSGKGAQSVLPPSETDGFKREWEISLDECESAALPEIVVQRILALVAKPVKSTTAQAVTRTDDPFNALCDVLDLDADPGVPLGERHKRALQLIGSHVGRGESADVVLQKALAWAKRCSPPADPADIEQIVTDLAAKDGNKANAQSVPVESVPWPKLDEAALYGLAGDIVRRIEPHTEADPVAILVQFLVMFGNVIGRTAHFLVESTKHFTNLFSVICGESAKARKGTSQKWAEGMVCPLDEMWAHTRFTSSLSSGEGLINAVRDARTEQRQKGRTGEFHEVLVPGVDDKRLLVLQGEFGSTLKVLQRDGNTLSSVVRDAWDGSQLDVLTRTNSLTARDSHISIIGHITKDELKKYLLGVEAMNGFANRFLWVCAKRSKRLPDGGGHCETGDLQKRLMAAYDAATHITTMQRDEQAAKLWRELYEKLGDGEDGVLGAVTARAEAQIVRLSMVYALLDGSAVIRKEHLQAAAALWGYADQSARYIFGSTAAKPLAERVLDVLHIHGPQPLTGLHRHFANHVRSGALGDALASLRAANRVVHTTDTSTGGRPADVWQAL